MSCTTPKQTTYYGISPAALAQIRSMRDAIQNSSEPGLYAPMYQAIFDDIKDNPNVDQGTKNWLEIAVKVNAGDPGNLVFQYVRTETQAALAESRKTISDARFTEGSNSLGQQIIDRVLQDGTLASVYGSDGLVERDAQAVVQEFGGKLSDWAGVTPYNLGDYYLGVDTERFTAEGKEKGLNWYIDVANKATIKTIEGGANVGQLPYQQLVPEIEKYFGGLVRHFSERAACEINSAVNSSFAAGLAWFQRRDPLILDLDGDGIELTPSNSTVLFDHNADGIKTGTQWAKSDDGILVRDLNGNGTIDSGRELFGDQTQISTVNAQGQTVTTLATNGFQALSALDKDAAGLSDGIFNASDLAYAELKVWRDLNQDGVSQSNELLGLAESGVSAINLTQTATQVTQGKSTFTKTVSGVDANGNPVTTSTEQTEQNVNFTTNNFYREFSDNPVVTEAAAALPQMQGAGLVRDLPAEGQRMPPVCHWTKKSITMKRRATYGCCSIARTRFHYVKQGNLGLQVIDWPGKVLAVQTNQVTSCF